MNITASDLYEFETNYRVKFENRDTAFDRRIQSFAIVNLEHIDIKVYLKDIFPIFVSEITKIVNTSFIIKVGACFIAEFKKNEEKMKLHVYCEYEIIDIDTVENDNLSIWFQDNIVDKVLKRVEEFETKGSGWQFDSIIELEVGCNQYDVLRGGSYIPLCKFLNTKKAIINVKNSDNQCFMWSILSAIHPQHTNPQRVEKYYSFRNELNFTGIEFPIQLSDIKKFEELNPTFSINVYMFDDDKKRVYPVRLTKAIRNHHIHLLLMNHTLAINGTDFSSDKTIKMHYCWIKDMSRLIRSQITRNKNSIYFCDRCIQHFTSMIRLNEHTPICMQQNNCRIEMPNREKGDHIIQFNNYAKKLTVPFVIYADIESILMKTTQQFCKTTKKPKKTTAYQEHVAYSAGYYLHCNFDESMSYYNSNRGKNCIEWFISEMHRIACDLAPILRKNTPLRMTSEDEERFQNTHICHICEKSVLKDKVRDHCHLTGKYRGAAHSECNILYESSKTIPIIFHNLSGYDSHFFIREISKKKYKGDISIIPVNDQNYISFTKTIDDAFVDRNNFKNSIKLKFIDSFRFMASSLDKLASYLPSEKKTILRKVFNSLGDDDRLLLERKGVFPYDYIDSWDKLNETRLPSRENFHSQLYDHDIDESEYQFAHEVWSRMNIQDLGQYADLYLKTDILLLADVFENFRSTCLKIYKLDPTHYFTAPGFSWDAMLRHTGVQIELLTDVNVNVINRSPVEGSVSVQLDISKPTINIWIQMN